MDDREFIELMQLMNTYRLHGDYSLNNGQISRMQELLGKFLQTTQDGPRREDDRFYGRN